jgi:hypothetical protein
MIKIHTYPRRVKRLFERQETSFTVFVNFGKFPCSWIRIRIPNTDRTAKSMLIRIHNTLKRTVPKVSPHFFEVIIFIHKIKYCMLVAIDINSFLMLG